jgi:hypothetical protein
MYQLAIVFIKEVTEGVPGRENHWSKFDYSKCKMRLDSVPRNNKCTVILVSLINYSVFRIFVLGVIVKTQ